MKTVDLYRRFPPRSLASTDGLTVPDSEILALWRRGKDTYDIAAILQVPEPLIERRLHLAKDILLREQEWSWKSELADRGEP